MQIVLILSLSLLLGVSILTIIQKNIRKAVILSGLLTSIAAFIFLLLLAPDVALAQAIMGSTLSTIVILLGIRYIRVVDVIYSLSPEYRDQVHDIFEDIYLESDHDLQFASNKELTTHNYAQFSYADYLVTEDDNHIYLYSRREGQDYLSLVQRLSQLDKSLVIRKTIDEGGEED